MRRLILILLAAVLAPSAYASIDEIDALVEAVRQEALQEAAHDEERIERFLAARDEQAELLSEVRAELARQNARADELRAEYEDNERTLTRYEAELTERAGDLNDTFAIVRQAALNANSILKTSLVAAEDVDRSPFLEELGHGQQPPSIDDIKRL
jgi:biopolymer transport protein ExbB